MIPDGWTFQQLKHHVDLISGQHVPARLCGEHGMVPYLTGPADFYSGVITVTKYTCDPRVLCRRGDILITAKGSGTGTIVVADQTYCISRQLMALRPRNLMPSFAYYAVLSRSRRYRLAAVGLIPGISRRDILNTRIAVPPLPEQRAIVEVLSTWDRAIELTSRLIDAKKNLKKGLMQQLLTGKTRFPEFQGQEWRRCRIGEILKEENRWVDWDEDALYRLASVRRWNGGLFFRGQLRGREIKVKKLKTIHTGDFLISHIQGAYGAMALVSDEFNDMKVSDLYSVLIPRTDVSFDIRLFSYLSQMPRMRRQVYTACNGFFAERLRLNFSPHDFLSQMIRVPGQSDEQRRIADVLDTITSEINLLERNLEALKRQKKGLMQKLLTGQVRVKVEPRHHQPTEEERSR